MALSSPAEMAPQTAHCMLLLLQQLWHSWHAWLQLMEGGGGPGAMVLSSWSGACGMVPMTLGAIVVDLARLLWFLAQLYQSTLCGYPPPILAPSRFLGVACAVPCRRTPRPGAI